MEIQFELLSSKAKLPTKRDEDAGYDIYPLLDDDEVILIKPHQTVMISTGIVSSMSQDYYVKLHERSSVGMKGLTVLGGVIDSGYRGEWKIILHNLTDSTIAIGNPNNDSSIITIPKSRAIAQAIICHSIKSVVKQTRSGVLSNDNSTLRCNQGFGSTSK